MDMLADAASVSASASLVTHNDDSDDHVVVNTKQKKQQRKKRNEAKLPHILMQLLNDETVPDAIWWLPGEKEFAINSDLFPSKVLEVYFPEAKYASFIRRLHKMGFSRQTRTLKKIFGGHIPYHAVAFRHEKFQRVHPELLDELKNGYFAKQKKIKEAMTMTKQAAASSGSVSSSSSTVESPLPPESPKSSLKNAVPPPMEAISIPPPNMVVSSPLTEAVLKPPAVSTEAILQQLNGNSAGLAEDPPAALMGATAGLDADLLVYLENIRLRRAAEEELLRRQQEQELILQRQEQERQLALLIQLQQQQQPEEQQAAMRQQLLAASLLQQQQEQQSYQQQQSLRLYSSLYAPTAALDTPTVYNQNSLDYSSRTGALNLNSATDNGNLQDALLRYQLLQGLPTSTVGQGVNPYYSLNNNLF